MKIIETFELNNGTRYENEYDESDPAFIDKVVEYMDGIFGSEDPNFLSHEVIHFTIREKNYIVARNARYVFTAILTIAAFISTFILFYDFKPYVTVTPSGVHHIYPLIMLHAFLYALMAFMFSAGLPYIINFIRTSIGGMRKCFKH